MSRSLHTTDLLGHLICGWNTPYAARLTHADERADAQLPHCNRPPGLLLNREPSSARPLAALTTEAFASATAPSTSAI